MARHRIGRVVRQEPRQVRRRIFQRQFQRFVVDGAGAKLFRRQFAFIDRRRVLDEVKQRGILRCHFRGLDAAQAVDEVIRHNRIAVGPVVIAEMEGPDEAVLAGFPTRRHAGFRTGIDAIGGQADEHVANDDVLPLSRRLVRIERIDLGRNTAPQCRHIAGRSAATTSAGSQDKGQSAGGHQAPHTGEDHAHTPKRSQSWIVCCQMAT